MFDMRRTHVIIYPEDTGGEHTSEHHMKGIMVSPMIITVYRTHPLPFYPLMSAVRESCVHGAMAS